MDPSCVASLGLCVGEQRLLSLKAAPGTFSPPGTWMEWSRIGLSCPLTLANDKHPAIVYGVCSGTGADRHLHFLVINLSAKVRVWHGIWSWTILHPEKILDSLTWQ